MTTYLFKLSLNELNELLALYPNLGKNSHVGNIAVRVVEKYFLYLDPNSTFKTGTRGADLEVYYSGKIEYFEIKGTTDSTIAWPKLKVSSKACFDALVNGMQLIRVTNIGSLDMQLHFMKYGEDFTLIPEDRWSVVKIKL
ncbi:hypothetical protein [Spirosoma aerophilum]